MQLYYYFNKKCTNIIQISKSNYKIQQLKYLNEL